MTLMLLFGILGAMICAAIASTKNRSVVGFGVIGFLLPLIGIILILVLPDGPQEESGQ